jgi:hypothetical protein
MYQASSIMPLTVFHVTQLGTLKKLRIARKYFMQGRTELDVISNPANSTTS